MFIDGAHFYINHGKVNKGLIIKTRDGDMSCEVGDYVIKEPFPTDDRKFYPCKPAIFKETYEEI